MKIFLNLTLFFISLNAFGKCQFNTDGKKIISLSGPMTVLIREMGLLKDPQLKGLSLFAPISGNEFSGTFYPGGVFLAPSVFNDFKGGVVFYDESRELRRIFENKKEIHSIEFKSRGDLPMETVAKSMHILTSYVSDCEKEFANVNARAMTIQKKLLAKIPDGLEVYFYLGEIKGDRLPELVMVNDGVVKLLIKENKIKTYPSPLSYVNWSSKVTKSFSKDAFYVGILDSARENVKTLKKNKQRMNLIYPGSLVPGLSQMDALFYWADEIF